MSRDFLQVFAICSAFVSSYFWIRLPWWRTFQTIRKMAESNKGEIERDLISQKADCEVALIGLGLSALAQTWVLFISPTIDELGGLGKQQGCTFVLTLIALYVIGNLVARKREKSFRYKYYR